MNLQVQHMTVFTYMPHDANRPALDLSVTMTAQQIERAICTMLGSLTDEQADKLLRREFPQLFLEATA